MQTQNIITSQMFLFIYWHIILFSTIITSFRVNSIAQDFTRDLLSRPTNLEYFCSKKWMTRGKLLIEMKEWGDTPIVTSPFEN